MVNEEEKIQIDIYLNEYQACHRNRNHYDSVRWSIGSIFIAASFTVFGFSLGQNDISVAFSLILLSLFSFFTWYVYFQHVNPFVMASIVRMQEIEKELRNMGYKINLHNSIRNLKRELRGIWITFCLLLFMSFAWIYKILLLFNIFNFIYFFIFIIISGFIIYIFHFRIFKCKNWVEIIHSI